MRRVAPSLPIPPHLLKHFAAATLAITTCIAIFADGETTEAVAETVKKNELKKAEVDALGSRKQVYKSMQVKTAGPMTYDDPSPGAGGNTSYYDGPTMGPSYRSGGNGNLSARPEDFLPGGEQAKKARKAAEPRKLTPEELAKLQEAARERTGAVSVN